MRGVVMERFVGQVQDIAGKPDTTFNLRTKCVLVAIYENDGKTILQPLTAEQEAKTIPELFQNKTLEVWLSNGQPDLAQFDVNILKYKQLLQPSTMCARIKTLVCLKNYFETIVACKQCPLSTTGGKE